MVLFWTLWQRSASLNGVSTCLAGRLWLLLACVVLSGSFPAVSGLYLLGCAFLAVARLLCPFSGSLLIFPYRAPPRNQKPRKNHGFLLSPTKKIGIGRGYETPFFCDFTHTHETPQIAMTFWHPLPLLLLGSADNGHVISQEFEGWVFCVRRSSPVNAGSANSWLRTHTIPSNKHACPHLIRVYMGLLV